MILHFSVSSYTLVTSSDQTCHKLTTLSECSDAAVALSLDDTIAEYDDNSGNNNAPPHCYFEGGVLKFNSNGLNTGVCTTSAQCVCRVCKYFG